MTLSVRRVDMLTMLTYLETGSHKAVADHMAISISTSRQRVSRVIQAAGVTNAMQAVWVLREQLEAEGRRQAKGSAAKTFRRDVHTRTR